MIQLLREWFAGHPRCVTCKAPATNRGRYRYGCDEHREWREDFPGADLARRTHAALTLLCEQCGLPRDNKSAPTCDGCASLGDMCAFAAGPLGAFTCEGCGTVATPEPHRTLAKPWSLHPAQVPASWRTIAIRRSPHGNRPGGISARAVCSPACAAQAITSMWNNYDDREEQR